METKADLLDLIWLQMVKEKAATPEADLYSWVARYFQSLDAIAIGGRVSGTSGDRKELVNVLKALGWREYKQDEGMDSIDFHYMERLLAGLRQDRLDETSTGSQPWTHRVELANWISFERNAVCHRLGIGGSILPSIRRLML
ncbi:MAG: hypothetical protein OXI87_19740 [Albidovulum sp.]|nr:hypothetical protein [Albidovulum sp.]